MKLKQMIYMILGLVFVIILQKNYIYAQDFYYDYSPTNPSIDTTQIGDIIKEDAVKPQSSLIYKLRQTFRLTGGIYEEDKSALAYIKTIINIALGLVSFVSLVLIIYAFYLMFFTEQEEGLTKAKKILKGVAIAITIMGLSYFIISFLFFVYSETSGT